MSSLGKAGLSRRSFLRISAAAAAGAALAACGATPTATSVPVPPTATKPAAPTAVPPSPTPAPKKPVTLTGYTFFTWGGYTGNERSEWITNFTKEKGRAPKDDEIPVFDKMEFWNKVTADFKAAGNSNVTLTWESLGWANDRPKLEVRVASGDPPDLVGWSLQDSLRFNLLGVMTDLGKAIAPYKSDYNTAFLPQFNGQYVIMPMQGFVHGWRVNTLLFQANGVDNLLPTEKTSWMWSHDDFLKACQAVTKGSGNTASYGYAGYGDWTSLYPFTFSFGGKVWGDDGRSFVMADDPKAIQGIQFMVDLVKKYKVAPPENMTDAVGNIVNDLYLSARCGINDEGNLGMKDWFDEQVTLGKVDTKKVQYNAIVCPSDVKNNVKPQHYSSVSGLSIFKRKETERIDAATDFLIFLQKPEYAKIYRRTNWPVRKVMENDADKTPYKAAYMSMMSSFASTQLMGAWWVACRSIINPMWDALFQGAKPAADVLKEAQGKVNEYIKTELKRVGL